VYIEVTVMHSLLCFWFSGLNTQLVLNVQICLNTKNRMKLQVLCIFALLRL